MSSKEPCEHRNHGSSLGYYGHLYGRTAVEYCASVVGRERKREINPKGAYPRPDFLPDKLLFRMCRGRRSNIISHHPISASEFAVGDGHAQQWHLAIGV